MKAKFNYKFASSEQNKIMQERVMDADKRRDAEPNEMTTARLDQLGAGSSGIIVITPKRNNSLHADRLDDGQPHLSHLHAKLRTRYADRC